MILGTYSLQAYANALSRAFLLPFFESGWRGAQPGAVHVVPAGLIEGIPGGTLLPTAFVDRLSNSKRKTNGNLQQSCASTN